MSLSVFKDLTVGWSVGYDYINEKEGEDEIKQGKNFYLSSVCVIGQLIAFTVLLSKVNDSVPNYPFKGSVKLLFDILPVAGGALNLFCVTVKEGGYETVAELYNNSNYCYIQLPKKLGTRAVAASCFFAEHTGDLIQGAMVAASIFLMTLGQTLYAGATLAALTYHIIDQKGFIPRRVSLLMEIYMPIVSNMGMLIGGTLSARVFCAFKLSTQFSSSVQRSLLQKIDQFIRSPFPSTGPFKWSGPSLAEIDAPAGKLESMTCDQIIEILNSPDNAYKINPAHCSKAAVNLSHFSKNFNFEQFIILFDRIDWTSKYELIIGKLKDDDRFIDFLAEKYFKTNKNDLSVNVKFFMKQLAAEKNVSSKKYAADWMREQIVQLSDTLQGKIRIKGSQQDLDEAIQSCSIILSYLLGSTNQIEIEDDLLALAVEGGGYCARGVKRVANELLHGLIQNEISKNEADRDLIGNYELKIALALQIARGEILQEKYTWLVNQGKIPKKIASDVHGYDIFHTHLALGFYPLMEFERHQFGFLELLTWQHYSMFRNMMYEEYAERLDTIVHDSGEFEFGLYLQQVIWGNCRLNEREKDWLLEVFTERNDSKWTLENTQKKFHKILLVKLGVLIPG